MTAPSSRPTDADSASTTAFDAIVIGSGSGGLTVAVGLSRFGKQVCMIERHHVGGDCTNVGCIPSKALLHATAEPAGRDAAAILSHVRAKRDHLRDEETEEFSHTDGIDLRFGSARVVTPDRVEITGPDGRVESVTADHVVVATGSRPRPLEIPGLPGDMMVTNEHLFELDDAPGHLVIVGGGPIGAEMATAFRRLGSRVTVLEAADRILPAYLAEASAIVARSLVADRVDLRPGSVAHRYDPATRSLAIGPLGGEVTGRVDDVDLVLVAVGRIPNSDGIGLEALDVETDRGGRLVVDARGRTSVRGIWATGDVSDRGGTTHAANAWGRRIIKSIVAPPAPIGDEPVEPAVAFTAPEAATIGLQPETPPGDVRRVVFDASTSDRAFTDEVEEALIVVDVRRVTGRILGATVVGPRAGELISTFSLAMHAGMRLPNWYGTVWPYPSYSDALGRMVDQFMVEHFRNLPRDLPRWAVGRLRALRPSR